MKNLAKLKNIQREIVQALDENFEYEPCKKIL